ncbi:MAG: succinate:quinone oxidoreductase [Verrucomicrobiales bacterium]|nr:succinate:quinone oxidoreductase [Verrucomicrobiales bacterium]
MSPIVQSLCRFYHSSIGKKIIVAVTGLGLMGFILGHLLGNLQIFLGPDTINTYAKKLHDLGLLLWVVRLGLLAMVAAHIVFTIQLTRENRTARKQKYALDGTRKATKASVIMIWSGVTILVFIIYHLMHFTITRTNGYYDPAVSRYWLPDGSHNVYNMMIDGFRVWYVSAFYILGMFLLCSHLSHGFASVFQTLGLATPRLRRPIHVASLIFAWGVFAGNVSIPLAILSGLKS